MATRDVIIQFRSTEAQRDALDWYAKQSGTTRAHVVRTMLPSSVPDFDRGDDAGEVKETVEMLEQTFGPAGERDE